MKVIDLTEEHEALYFVCLEDWSEEMQEAGDHKQRWYHYMKDCGLRVKLVQDDEGVLAGMIQYLPIEQSPVEGRDMYYILCIWIHGHKEGRGDFRKQGMGKALLAAAEQDARERGARAMVAWGMSLPIWMRSGWYKKQGYEKIDSIGIQSLLWKKFAEDAEPPRWIRQQKKPERLTGKVVVTGLVNGWCPSMNINFERARRAVTEFDDKVVFREIDTLERTAFLEWGLMDGVFIDGELISTGPPLSYDKIKRKIAKKLHKLEKQS